VKATAVRSFGSAPAVLAGFRSHRVTPTHLCARSSLSARLAEAGGFSPHGNGGLLREVHFHLPCWLYGAARHFVGGRRAFRTGERTHGRLSDLQGQVSATAYHPGHRRGRPKRPGARRLFLREGFGGQHSPQLRSHQRGPPPRPLVLALRGKAMCFGGLLATGRKLRGEKPVSNMQAFNTLILKTETVVYFVNAYLN